MLLREKVSAWLRWVCHAAREVLYGMTVYGMVRGLRRQRADVEHLFVLIAFGDIVGLPIIPPYYTLRLLPHIVPLIDTWRRRMLRERDLTDLADLIEDVG